MLLVLIRIASTTCCGYSLEWPRRGDSNEYPQHICFHGDIMKTIPKLSSNTLLICSTVKLHCLNFRIYRNDPKFSDRYAWANSADPDQTAPRGAV